MLGNLLTSGVAAAGTYVWLVIFNVPYALLLALVVGIFDLIPIVGSTIAGIIVSLVACSKGLPTGVATAGFYVAYRYLKRLVTQPTHHEAHGEGDSRLDHCRYLDRCITARHHRSPDCHTDRCDDSSPVARDRSPQTKPEVR